MVRELLQVRRRVIVPRLAGSAFGKADAASNGLLTADWRMGDGTTLHLTANLSEKAVGHDNAAGTPIWGSELGSSVPPWSVHWRIG
jgi:maltooligosyltrehalose trehalohydrolase